VDLSGAFMARLLAETRKQAVNARRLAVQVAHAKFLCGRNGVASKGFLKPS
jgi:hypothetical protein